MKKYVKWVIAVTLIVALSVCTVFASSGYTTPLYLKVTKDAVDEVVRPSGGSGSGSGLGGQEQPSEPPTENQGDDTEDFSGFSKTEKENYEKLSSEAKGVVRAAKAATQTIRSANSTLHEKRAVVVSWTNSFATLKDGTSSDQIKWSGSCIYRSKTGKFSSNPKAFFEVKNKNWYKNNKSLKLSNRYYYKVRSYIIVEGYRFWSSYSDVTSTYVQDIATYTSAEKAAYKKLSSSEKKQTQNVKTATIKLYKNTVTSGAKLKWNVYEASRAKKSSIEWTGAELYYSKSKSMKNMQRIASSKGSSFSVKKSTGLLKKTGYYRVRLYKEIDGTKYYSRYSDILKVRI